MTHGSKGVWFQIVNILKLITVSKMPFKCNSCHYVEEKKEDWSIKRWVAPEPASFAAAIE